MQTSSSKIRLFDEFPRNRAGTKSHNESTFNYYNTSGRRDVYQIRGMLEMWFESFPEEGKIDLRQRFRSPEDWQHKGAFHELYMHELLLGMGFKVTNHPSLEEAGSGRPDFLVSKGNKPIFYLECTIVTRSKEERASESMKAQVYEMLEHMQSHFFLNIHVEGAPTTAPPGRQLVRRVEDWLSTLNWQSLRSEAEVRGSREMPTMSWSHEGWILTISAWPKSEELHGKIDAGSLGMIMPEVRMVEDVSVIRQTITKKGHRYKKLELPLVVSLLVLLEFVDDISIMSALFGDLCSTVSWNRSGELSSHDFRKRNGAWLGKKGPRYTRISGVVISSELSPWSVKTRIPLLMHNPWASKSLEQSLWPLKQRVPNDSCSAYDLIEGDEVSRFVRCPQAWPPPVPNFDSWSGREGDET